MANTTYNTELDGVEPIFYPVVPDSFMLRGEERAVARIPRQWSTEWPEQIDRPLSSPHDRWSF